MRIKKTFQTTVPTGKVLNSYTESNVDTYSCNYINGLETYSTDETRVGTWVDGKPIYRKVVSNLSNGDTIVSNVSDIVFHYIIINYNSATNYYNHSNTEVTLDKSTHRAIINSYNTMQNSTFVVIIEYTKTTD